MTTETKHTRGPWKVNDKTLSGAYQISNNKPGSLRICTVTNAPNDKANAQLIAAAPDMLNTMKEAANSCRPAVLPIICYGMRLPRQKVNNITRN